MNRFFASLMWSVAALVSAGHADPAISAEKPMGVVAVFQTPDESGLSQAAVSSSGEILLGSARGTIWRWNPHQGTAAELRLPVPAGGAISHLLWDQDGSLFAGSGFNLQVRKPREEFRGIKIPRLSQMAVSPDGRQIAGIVEEPPIVFFDARTGEKTHRLDRQVWVDEMHYSPSGEFLATSRYSRIYLWKSSTGDLVWKSRLEDNVRGFAFSPDETTIFASMAREGLWVIDLATGNVRNRYGRLPGGSEEESPHRLAYSPDGMLLADTSTPDRIEIWETFTGRPLLLLGQHPGKITDLQFLPEGTRLVSVDDSGRAYLWDLRTPEFADPFDVSKLYTEDQLRQLWEMLGEPHGQATWTSMIALKHRPEQALALIDAPPDDDLLIRELIDRLDHDQFMVRQAASRALRQLSLKAEPFLRKTLSTSGSAEAKVRIRRLLSYLSGPHREAQRQLMEEAHTHRQIRVVHLLKWIGTPEAQKRLKALRDSSENPVIRAQAATALGERNEVIGAPKK